MRLHPSRVATFGRLMVLVASHSGLRNPNITSLILYEPVLGGLVGSGRCKGSIETAEPRSASRAGMLNAGLPRPSFAGALATTSEYRTDVITGNGVKTFYQLYLGRSGDSTGVAYWVNRMAGVNGSPLTFEQVRLQFIDSPEYSAATGPNQGDQSTIIKALYTEVLGRPFDQPGLTYWMANYNVNTIGSQFLFSSEGRSFLVDTLYHQILSRTAVGDPGMAFWTNALVNGASDENIIASILGSVEYYNAHH